MAGLDLQRGGVPVAEPTDAGERASALGRGRPRPHFLRGFDFCPKYLPADCDASWEPAHAARGQSQHEVLPPTAGTPAASGLQSDAALVPVEAPQPSSLFTSAEASTAVCGAPLSARPPTAPPLTPQQEAWASSQPLSPSEASSRASPAGSGLECWLAAWGALARDKEYFAWAKGSGLAGDVREAAAQLPRVADPSRKRGPTG